MQFSAFDRGPQLTDERELEGCFFPEALSKGD